jgi:Fe-S cluster assembly iron-binding protein IscA
MLTPEAAETIKHLADSPGAGGLRIFGAEQSPDGRGPQLQIAMVDAPETDDAIVEAEGATLYLDAAAERTMDDKILHAALEGDHVRFELLRQSEAPD